MQENALVSVVIPTYNRAGSIIKAVESVLNQTYQNIEIIVVDDNSSDNTEELIKLLGNDKIRYIKNEMNLGPSGARNKGIQHAKGEYIAFQDSDDEWLPSKLEQQLQLFQQEDYGLVYCAYRYLKGSLNYKYPSEKYSLEELEGNIFESMFEMNKISTQTMIIKKEVLKQVGGFEETLRCLEDWELALRICYKYKIGFVNEMLVNVNYSKNSVNYNYRNALDAYIYMVKKNKDLVRDKTKLCEMISAIMRHMLGELTQEEFLIYKEKVVPEVMDETMFHVLLHESKRSVKYKSNYEMAMRMSEIHNLSEKLAAYLKTSKINSVAIYGVGRVGIQLINVLKETDVKVSFAIDENKSVVEGIKTVSMKEIEEKVDVVIVTTSYDFNQISKELKLYVNSQIINLESMLVSELL